MTPAQEAARVAIENQLTPIQESLTKWEAKQAPLERDLLRLNSAYDALDNPLKKNGRKAGPSKDTATEKSQVIEAARQGIEQLRVSVREKLEQVTAKVCGLRDEEQPLAAALKALTAAKTAPVRKRRSPNGKSVTKQEVVLACVETLRKEHALPAAELEKQVGCYLKEQQGRNLMGYSRRFAEAMKTEEFATVEDGVVVLAVAASPTASQPGSNSSVS